MANLIAPAATTPEELALAIRREFCREHHRDTVELKRYAGAHGFRSTTPERHFAKRRLYLRAVLCHTDPEWWLERREFDPGTDNWLCFKPASVTDLQPVECDACRHTVAFGECAVDDDDEVTCERCQWLEQRAGHVTCACCRQTADPRDAEPEANPARDREPVRYVCGGCALDPFAEEVARG